MNSQNRTSGTNRNQKKTSNNSSTIGNSGIKKTDVKIEKEKIPKKPTAEQIRIAEITDCRSEDPKMREKVATLIEMTQRTEEEVCCALYECDNNLEKAVDFLLESLPVGAFETSSKKKKTRTANATTDDANDGDWAKNNNNNADNRERSRNRTAVRSRGGTSDNRGWRGRETRQNERDTSESKGGRGNRGGFGGRGGRGGRAGPRGMGFRDSRRSYSRQQRDTTQQSHTQEVDTWDNAIATNAEQMKQPDAFSDTWGDWDNEEYVGSLKDTKVFTPSNLQTQNLSAPPGLEQHLVNSSNMKTDDLVQQYNTGVANTTTDSNAGVNSVQYADIQSTASTNSSQHLTQLGIDAQQMNTSSALSAEQSQYFNSLPSQAANQQGSVNSYKSSSVQYPTSYVPNNVFGDQGITSHPPVRRARAKLPPPSKIPSIAVEMPGDTLNNVGYLDVQFGGLDFSNDESFDALTEKFNAASIENQQNVQSKEVSASEYSTKPSTQQTSLPATLQTSPMIAKADALSSSKTDSLTSSYSQQRASVPQQSTGVSSTITTSVSGTLDQLSKNSEHPYNQSSSSNTAAYQNSYNANSSANKSSYQSSGSTHGYNNSNYSSSTQVSSGNSYQPSSNSAYNTYNQNAVNTYQQQQSNAAVNNTSNSTSGSVANSVSGTQNIPVGGPSSAVNNSSSSNTNAVYASNQYPSNQTASTFATQQSGYQSNQSVYGTSSVANSSGATSSGAVSSAINSVSNSSTTISMSSPSLGLTNTKVTTSSTAKGAAGILPNIQMVSQYIQTGVPYYQQPAVYSYEDIQMMQQRMPHVTQYYDINYPPTSLEAAGVRDANLGSVAYSTMTDGRFTRTDNNSSPVSNVSSAMSQQAGSSGPMLNVPYAYFYGGNMMPGGFQYGTPAIYAQQMPTANATSGGQLPKPSYNSGYGSTSYDALGQATQDYTKGTYASSGVSQQTKVQNVSNTPQAASASDIASSMYGKSHVALNKVNSYDKQSFHSATPPPFNLTGTQTAAATSAQPYGMYIQPMPAAHHNMNMHQPIHQDSSSAGQRQQGTGQKASGTKQGYSPSYWPPQN